jgi:hypothetical protein
MEMKKILFFFSLALITFTSCKDTVSEMVTYKINEPVFMSAVAFRSSVKVSTVPRTIVNYGKMCFYQGYLYISESEKGIHIIDNQNPTNPQKIGFIELLGNADLSIRNGLLYADSYVDLVWFEISNPALPTLKGRLENVFTTALPKMDNNYGFDYNAAYSSVNKGIIIGWELKEKTEEVTHYTGGWWWGRPEIMMDGVYALNTVKGGSSTGITGSMSRFTIYNDNLYAVINNAMSIFDLTGEQPHKAAENIYLGWNVETIFSYKDNMFMGTPTGLLIYSVKDPLKPEYQSSIQHVYGCDPVVVENDIAYVTVHSGNSCGQNSNDLIIIDVSDTKNPKQIVSYAMTNPKGLGIDNGKLFLCDDGLKIYNVSTPKTIMANQLAHYSGMDGFDVIAYNNILMMIAQDGLYQYDYSNINEIKQISKISIGK